MGSEENKAWVRKKRKRNVIAKGLEDRKYRQRKIDKNYKMKKQKEIADSFVVEPQGDGAT